MPAQPPTTRQSSWRTAVREFLFGMLGYEMAHHALEMRASTESLFMLATVGDMLGVPIYPYSARYRNALAGGAGSIPVRG